MRTKKTMKNLITSILQQFIILLCGLITPRLILNAFGSTYNGVISSANQFLSVINVLTLGITGSTRLALYKTLSENDIVGTSRIMKSTKTYLKKVAFALAIYAVILSLLYPFISHNELSYYQNTLLIIIVSIGSFAHYFFGFSNQVILIADQSNYVINILDIIKTLINTFFVVVLIKLDCSIYIVKLGSAIAFVIAPIVLNIIVKKKYGLITNCEPDNEALKNRSSVAAHSVANLVHDNTDLVILTLFTDAKVISVYTVYNLIAGSMKSLFQCVTTGLEAAFGNMWVKKEITALKKNFEGLEYIIFSLSALLFSCMGMLILPFVECYTSMVTDVQYVRSGLAFLITISMCTYCYRHPYMILVYAVGNYESTKKGAILEAVINIIVSVLLVIFIGINGVIIGTLVANVFRTTQYIIYTSKNILNRPVRNAINKVLWSIGTSVVICLLSYLIKGRLDLAFGWVGWIQQAILTFMVAVLVVLGASYVFYKEDMKQIMVLIKRMIKK